MIKLAEAATVLEIPKKMPKVLENLQVENK
ncbi:hypothetical protein LCGC14_0173550 [marine sediment metagenome]|jgi:hypothetical protein|uniref:Uncharacterized protein n=1 Tax=marine sediment metagenome TaxID=412755 RepID=A0A0F9XA24_9ZZZZ